MPTPVHAFADHAPGGHVERGEQRGRTVPLVVMRHSASSSRHHGQGRLGAIQHLDPALLVHVQHDQWVRPSGLDVVVSMTIRSTTDPGIDGLRPRPGATAANPSRTRSENSRRHARCT